MKRLIASAALAAGMLLPAAPALAVPYPYPGKQTPVCIALQNICMQRRIGAVCTVWRQQCVLPKPAL